MSKLDEMRRKRLRVRLKRASWAYIDMKTDRGMINYAAAQFNHDKSNKPCNTISEQFKEDFIQCVAH